MILKGEIFTSAKQKFDSYIIGRRFINVWKKTQKNSGEKWSMIASLINDIILLHLFLEQKKIAYIVLLNIIFNANFAIA